MLASSPERAAVSGRRVLSPYGPAHGLVNAIAAFLLAPDWPDDDGRRKRLFHVVKRPFRNVFERALARAYGFALDASGAHPCLLRPADLLLRTLGMRWYGYTLLSNRLWTSTTS